MDQLVRTLARARTAWDDEVRQLEAEIEPKVRRIRFLREQLSSADRLLCGINGGKGSVPEAAPNLRKRIEIPPRLTHRGFAPMDAYREPILESLVELGGSGERREVLPMIEKRMQHLLTPGDYEKTAGGHIRWEHHAEFQVSNMKRAGLLSPTSVSGRGRWEITPEGGEWLSKLRTSGLR